MNVLWFAILAVPITIALMALGAQALDRLRDKYFSHRFVSSALRVSADSGAESHLALVKDAHRRAETVPLQDLRRAIPDLNIGALGKPIDAPKPAVTITTPDYQELSAAIVAAKKLATDPGAIALLQEKLANATVLGRGDLRPDLITMNTRAELFDPDTNELLNLMLVYPVDADIQDGRVSAFHPLGAAMLGHLVGEKFEWRVPYGTRQFEVKSIRFQPEAALQQAA
jgi:regulator of nucleoside diphosphate kinase